MGNRSLLSHLLKTGNYQFWISLAALATFVLASCGANAPPTPPVHSSNNADAIAEPQTNHFNN